MLVTCVGSVVVCVAMTVVMGGNLEEAVLLLGLDKTGNCSANFSNCLSVFSSSAEGILMLMLSGWLLVSSSSELYFPSSMGPHSLRSVTSESGISTPTSGLGILWVTQQLFLVFESPVSRLEKNRDWTGLGLIRTRNYMDR